MTVKPPKTEYVQDDDAVVDQPVEQVIVDKPQLKPWQKQLCQHPPKRLQRKQSLSRCTPKRAALKRMRRRTQLMPRQRRKPTAAQRSPSGSRNWRSSNLLPVRSPNLVRRCTPLRRSLPSAYLTTTSPASSNRYR